MLLPGLLLNHWSQLPRGLDQQNQPNALYQGRFLSAELTTFSFPLRTLSATGQAAPKPSSFMLNRFHGDETNLMIRRWCDSTFMSGDQPPWPLVLYGPSATGKTVLAETLACRLNLNCLQLNFDDFRRQFHSALATRSIDVFRQRLQSHEMLLLDDLVLSADEPELIRELVQIVDFYGQNKRPLIVTTQIVPWMMGAPFAQLRSRLCEGLAIQVKRPGVAAKREIAAEILKHFDLKIFDEDLDWLANSLPDTAPLIKNYLSQIALHADDPLLTRTAIKSSTSSDPVQPQTIQQLTKLVARQLGQRVSDINGKTRRKEVVRARSVAMFLARDLLQLTYRQVGEFIGNRDPSTVRHACSQIRDGINSDAGLADAVKQVSAKFSVYQSKQTANFTAG